MSVLSLPIKSCYIGHLGDVQTLRMQISYHKTIPPFQSLSSILGFLAQDCQLGIFNPEKMEKIRPVLTCLPLDLLFRALPLTYKK
jgi:hypothetical protein